MWYFGLYRDQNCTVRFRVKQHLLYNTHALDTNSLVKWNEMCLVFIGNNTFTLCFKNAPTKTIFHHFPAARIRHIIILTPDHQLSLGFQQTVRKAMCFCLIKRRGVKQWLNLRKQALASLPQLAACCMDRGLEGNNPLAGTLVIHVQACMFDRDYGKDSSRRIKKKTGRRSQKVARLFPV